MSYNWSEFYNWSCNLIPEFIYHVCLCLFCFQAVNSCSVLNGGCEHKCVDMGNNHYKCECRRNYQLKRDGRHCECKLFPIRCFQHAGICHTSQLSILSYSRVTAKVLWLLVECKVGRCRKWIWEADMSLSQSLYSKEQGFWFLLLDFNIYLLSMFYFSDIISIKQRKPHMQESHLEV